MFRPLASHKEQFPGTKKTNQDMPSTKMRFLARKKQIKICHPQRTVSRHEKNNSRYALFMPWKNASQMGNFFSQQNAALATEHSRFISLHKSLNVLFISRQTANQMGKSDLDLLDEVVTHVWCLVAVKTCTSSPPGPITISPPLLRQESEPTTDTARSCMRNSIIASIIFCDLRLQAYRVGNQTMAVGRHRHAWRPDEKNAFDQNRIKCFNCTIM